MFTLFSGNKVNLQNKRDVLFLSGVAVERNLYGLLGVADLVIAEEVDFHLVVVNCKNNQQN